MKEILNYIDGRFTPALRGKWIQNFDPSTGQVYSQVARSDKQDIDDAIQAAKKAFPGWSSMSADERSRHMLNVADRIESRMQELALAESTDQGKPLWLSLSVDITRAAKNFRFFATEILHSSASSYQSKGLLNYTVASPLGVVGCISPWNLPLYLFTWKIAPALAAGNCVIGKPSELTPMTASLLADICREVGFPPGVLNIVHGYGHEAGAAIVEAKEVKAISFTGGTKTGKTIAQIAAPEFKKLSLELGGKNATIVFEDANLDEAVTHSVRGAFTNQGEICLCGSRVLVQRTIFERFKARFVEKTRQYRIGDPLEDSTRVGAMVSEDHMNKVLSYIELARSLGGTIEIGGQRATVPGRCQNGWFIEPTVISGLDHLCAVNQEEIFGPVVSLIPFDSDSEAVEIANSTRYGLATTMWTQDLSRAHRVASTIESGIVWINCWMVRDLRTPFGGVKESGVGREGGTEALRFFTELKNVCIQY